MSLIISSLTIFFFTGEIEPWAELPSKSNEIVANTNFQLRVGLENLLFLWPQRKFGTCSLFSLSLLEHSWVENEEFENQMLTCMSPVSLRPCKAGPRPDVPVTRPIPRECSRFWKAGNPHTSLKPRALYMCANGRFGTCQGCG